MSDERDQYDRDTTTICRLHDRIHDLEAEVARLQAALRKIMRAGRIDFGLGSWTDNDCAAMARLALEQARKG